MSKNNLEEFIKDCFEGDNEIKYFISERGNQRIEITDKTNNETWQTLEATSKTENQDNYDEISNALLHSLLQQLEVN